MARGGWGSGQKQGVPTSTVQGAVAGYGGCITCGTQLDHAGQRTPRVVSSLEPLRQLQPQLQVATAEY